MLEQTSTDRVFEWEELIEFDNYSLDIVNGPTNSYSNLRLFNGSDQDIRVTLYRDNHAWCPYCQKVWLWLEYKKIPYKIKKVSMRCYGEKERWYLSKVPSGMLPALEIDNNLITESDQIILSLEKAFGPLGQSLEEPAVHNLRILERMIFRSWCNWLCTRSFTKGEEQRKKRNFMNNIMKMESLLSVSNNKFLDQSTTNNDLFSPGSCDIIFIPYIERMNASLAYYKGFNLREEHPEVNKWLSALEGSEVYRGTQGDMHTHAHDLPPQMGGCWLDSNTKQKEYQLALDSGEGLGKMETTYIVNEKLESEEPRLIALSRVIKHRKNICLINPIGQERFDQPLRVAITNMICGTNLTPEKGSAKGLRYLRDRISVPRDMPLLAARSFRQALEKTAALDGISQGKPIPLQNRFDQDPIPFKNIN